jgi:recombination protein RecA
MAKDKKTPDDVLPPIGGLHNNESFPMGENEVGSDPDQLDIEDVSQKCNEITKLPPVKEWLSTGCTVLDLAIANQLPGGIPIGRVVHVFGGGSTAKTVLGVTILGYAQRNEKIAYFWDVEHTLDQEFAKLFGLNCEEEKTFKLGHPENIEELFDGYINGVIYSNPQKKKINDKPKVIIVDSLTALPTIAESKEEMKEGSFSLTRPKQMSKGFRKYIHPLAISNTSLICIDQTRDSINAMFGPKEVTSGGRALEFYSSVGIYLKHDSNIVNKHKVVTGIWLKFKVIKNKVSVPFREGRFKISFDYGLDNISSNLYFLTFHQLGEKQARDKTSKLNLFGEERTQNLWTKYIEENNKEEELKQEVWKVWNEVHKTEQRKARVW